MGESTERIGFHQGVFHRRTSTGGTIPNNALPFLLPKPPLWAIINIENHAFLENKDMPDPAAFIPALMVSLLKWAAKQRWGETADATLGEITGVLRKVWGEYRPEM